MSEFIFKDLFFVSWTAFMAMELTGYAVKNSEKVYIEPIDYMPELCRAIETLDTSGLEVSIYNIPNCLIPEGFRRFAAQNISDWKTKYLDICDNCCQKTHCCGLFSTSKQIFKGLKAL